MTTHVSTIWSSKLLIAAMLTTGFARMAQGGPDATTSRTETSPALPPPVHPEIRPTEKPLTAPLSFWAAQIAKLAQAGIDDDIILSFLDNVGTVNLGADQIIYLTDQGVSRDVIAAMLQHDFEISNGWRPIPTTAYNSFITPSVHFDRSFTTLLTADGPPVPPRAESGPIFNFYMGKNMPERKDYIVEKLVVLVEE